MDHACPVTEQEPCFLQLTLLDKHVGTPAVTPQKPKSNRTSILAVHPTSVKRLCPPPPLLLRCSSASPVALPPEWEEQPQG